MGLMMSVLVFSIGVLEALSCAEHIRQSYLPLELQRKRRRLVIDHGTGSVRHRETRVQPDPHAYLRSLAETFPQDESECEELAAIFDAVETRNIHSTHIQEANLLPIGGHHPGRESCDGSELSTPATVILNADLEPQANRSDAFAEDDIPLKDITETPPKYEIFESIDPKQDFYGTTNNTQPFTSTALKNEANSEHNLVVLNNTDSETVYTSNTQTLKTDLNETQNVPSSIPIQDEEKIQQYIMKECETEYSRGKYERRDDVRGEPSSEMERRDLISDNATVWEIGKDVARSSGKVVHPGGGGEQLSIGDTLPANTIGRATTLAPDQLSQQPTIIKNKDNLNNCSTLDGGKGNRPADAGVQLKHYVSRDNSDENVLEHVLTENVIQEGIETKGILQEVANKVSEWLGFAGQSQQKEIQHASEDLQSVKNVQEPIVHEDSLGKTQGTDDISRGDDFTSTSVKSIDSRPEVKFSEISRAEETDDTVISVNSVYLSNKQSEQSPECLTFSETFEDADKCTKTCRETEDELKNSKDQNIELNKISDSNTHQHLKASEKHSRKKPETSTSFHANDDYSENLNPCSSGNDSGSRRNSFKSVLQDITSDIHNIEHGVSNDLGTLVTLEKDNKEVLAKGNDGTDTLQIGAVNIDNKQSLKDTRFDEEKGDHLIEQIGDTVANRNKVSVQISESTSKGPGELQVVEENRVQVADTNWNKQEDPIHPSEDSPRLEELAKEESIIEKTVEGLKAIEKQLIISNDNKEAFNVPTPEVKFQDVVKNNDSVVVPEKTAEVVKACEALIFIENETKKIEAVETSEVYPKEAEHRTEPADVAERVNEKLTAIEEQISVINETKEIGVALTSEVKPKEPENHTERADVAEKSSEKLKAVEEQICIKNKTKEIEVVETSEVKTKEPETRPKPAEVAEKINEKLKSAEEQITVINETKEIGAVQISDVKPKEPENHTESANVAEKSIENLKSGEEQVSVTNRNKVTLSAQLTEAEPFEEKEPAEPALVPEKSHKEQKACEEQISIANENKEILSVQLSETKPNKKEEHPEQALVSEKCKKEQKSGEGQISITYGNKETLPVQPSNANPNEDVGRVEQTAVPEKRYEEVEAVEEQIAIANQTKKPVPELTLEVKAQEQESHTEQQISTTNENRGNEPIQPSEVTSMNVEGQTEEKVVSEKSAEALKTIDGQLTAVDTSESKSQNVVQNKESVVQDKKDFKAGTSEDKSLSPLSEESESITQKVMCQEVGNITQTKVTKNDQIGVSEVSENNSAAGPAGKPSPVPQSSKAKEARHVVRKMKSIDDDDVTEVVGARPPPSSSFTRVEDITSPDKAFWLIFSGEYTKAMSKDWHSGHFCCWQCDESLTGQRYVLRDDHPYCIKCYEQVFANTCDECSKVIGIDSKDLSYKDKHWHEACFLCSKCRVSLVDKQFGSKADKIYCGNCYDAQFASRCDGCGQIFRAGTKKMEYKTRQWHEQCFCCCVCKTPIGTKSFIPREQEIYCAGCYEEKFATRCVKCNKIITSGGVTYKNEPWHRECFTCTHCNTSLAGQRFTSRDDKPYCADCFGELFAKRCTACCKPITGIGGTRFISFEDRHWHNDCFICAACKSSLVGRGFITDAEDILCTECAKQKLM